MANEKTPPTVPTPGAAPAAKPGRGKRALLIILAAVILLVLIGGIVIFVLMKSSQDEAEEEDATEVAQKQIMQTPPIFIKLDKFTVNLKPTEDGGCGDAYMQADITLQMDGQASVTHLNVLMPRVRNDLTLILSDRQAKVLIKREGKEELAGDIRESINRILNPSRKETSVLPRNPVKEVLFESIIIQ